VSSVALQGTNNLDSLFCREEQPLTVWWSICDYGWMMAHDGDSDAQSHSGGSGPADAPHPGLFLRRGIVAGRGLSVSEVAKALRVLRPTLSAVVNGRAALSPGMALRCEKAFGLAMETPMGTQCGRDSALMRARTHKVDVPPFVPRPKPGQGSLL
jgi:addiction module HigA family antidote